MATEEEFVLDLTKMKIADLKRELQIRNLKVSGNKQDLIQRLQSYLEEHEGAEVEDDGGILEDCEEEEEAPDPVEEKEKKEPELVETLKEEKEEEKEESSPVAVEPAEAPEKTADSMTDDEKKAARAKKFGLKEHELSNADRLANRSKRFGTSSSASSKSNVDPEKLKQRAERFGVISDVLVSKDTDEKKKKRLERFGNKAANDTPEVAEKKRKRAERFGISVA